VAIGGAATLTLPRDGSRPPLTHMGWPTSHPRGVGGEGGGGVAAMVGSGAKGGSPTIGHPFNFLLLLLLLLLLLFFLLLLFNF
jgi:hypothetical protein